VLYFFLIYNYISEIKILQISRILNLSGLGKVYPDLTISVMKCFKNFYLPHFSHMDTLSLDAVIMLRTECNKYSETFQVKK
jgi:hypothetical protein